MPPGKYNTDQRRKGVFYTPQIWVDEAHNFIEETLGTDWKEKYTVWDPACGTMNLTRDYEFNKLFASTIDQNEIDDVINADINPEATRFQYDFLNEGEKELKEKAPGLVKSFQNDEPIVFFMNPPFASANSAGTEEGDHKAGVAKTKIREHIKKDGWGRASQQLYTQFIYKIFKLKEKYGLSNVQIAMFTPPLFLSGSSFKKMRGKLLQEFRVQPGFMFPASEFYGVKNSWGVTFTILDGTSTDDRTEWVYMLKEREEDDN